MVTGGRYCAPGDPGLNPEGNSIDTQLIDDNPLLPENEKVYHGPAFCDATKKGKAAGDYRSPGRFAMNLRGAGLRTVVINRIWDQMCA